MVSRIFYDDAPRSRKPTPTPTPTPTPEEMPQIRADALKTLRERTEAQVLNAVQEVTPHDIAKAITADFQSIKRKIMLQVLGVDFSYGEVRLERDGRTHSPLLAWLTSEIGPDVEAAFRATIREEWEANKDKAIVEMKKAARRYLADNLNAGGYDFRKEVEAMCSQLRNDLLREVRAEMFPEIPPEALRE